MPSLQTLPTELLDSIFSQLSRKSLLNLSKTCKVLNATTSQHLYQNIRLTWKVGKKPAKQPQIASLLHTVLANPDRASAIKSIIFRAHGFTARTEGKLSLPKKVPVLEDKLIQCAKEALSKAKMPERAKWDAGLKENDLNAIIALLLSHLPNLQSLTLGAYFLHTNAFLPIMLAHGVDPTTTPALDISNFSKLEHVSLGVDMDEYKHDWFFLDMDVSAILPIFYLPNLRSAQTMLPSSPQPLTWPSTIDPPRHAASLTDLRFQRSTANASTVARILEGCAKLIALEYDYHPNYNKHLDCPVLVQALKSYKKTLKHLRICLQPYSTDTTMAWEYGEDAYQRSCLGLEGGLKAFSALETLEISLVVLLGWRTASALPLAAVLPPNLRTLTIRDDCWDFGSDGEWEWSDTAYTKLFYDFLKHGRWRDTCPDLQQINLRLEQTAYDDWAHERREKFKKMCDVKGLKCRIRKVLRDQDEVEQWGGMENREVERRVELETFFD